MRKITNLLLLVALVIGSKGVFAQHYNQELDGYDPDKKKDKLGIRVGMGFPTLKSPQLVNTRVTTGLEGAFYYRVNLFKGFHLNPEFGASIRGSRHRNGSDGYSRLSLFYFDFALLGLISVDPKNNHNIVLGAQYSRLVRSSLYVGNELNASYLQLPFKKYNISAVAGYHFNTQYVGIQLCLKYGLTNIAGDFANFNKVSGNGNNQFKDVKPSLTGLKDIRNISVELSLYF